MNATQQTYVENILTKITTSPLYFLSQENADVGHYVVAKLNYKRYCIAHDLADDILKTITLMQEFCSMRKDGDEYIFETSASRRRSALDIWRHLKSPMPELSFIAVMNTLYDLCVEEELVTSYCSMIHRRTFRIDEFKRESIYDAEHSDEFGFTFDVWSR